MPESAHQFCSMMPKFIPDYRNRSAESILSETVRFESSGYIYRALSWLDFAQREGNSVAFQYAADDARQGIEQLFFEELVLAVGTSLDRAEYEKCLGNSTKLHAIITRLAPEREKLATFNQAIFSGGRFRIPLMVWDHKLLMKYWGKISIYLHWAGAIDETIQNASWVRAGIKTTEEACFYIWNNQTQTETGVMMPHDMHPEIRHLWERYQAGSIGVEEVKISAQLLEPTISNG